MKNREALLCCAWVVLIAAKAQIFGQTNNVSQSPGLTVTNESPTINLAGAQERRLQWNRKTLVEDYEQHGKCSPKWDGPARKTLESFAQLRCVDPKDGKAQARLWAEVTTNVSETVALGCDDPMIKYLFARFELPNRNNSSETAGIYRSVAEAMTASNRAPIRKFYAALRASAEANNGSASAQPNIRKWHGAAREFLLEVARDTNVPPVEISEAWAGLLDNVTRNKQEFNDTYSSLAPVLFANWPEDPGLLYLKGYYYIEYAWEARGSGFSQSVADKGWALFSQRLNIADAALRQAWKLNPHDERIARRMITVELGLGRGRDQMEMWFQRAMEVNPNYYDACSAKLHYLKPQWYGSKEEMLAFAAECLTSPKWGGNVPLIILDVHNYFANAIKGQEERQEYYRRPEVWADLKQAFDKYFQLNPENTGWHHDYALYAYWAQQWDDLNRELKRLGEINYNYFGGKAEFEKIVAAAKAHAPKPKSP